MIGDLASSISMMGNPIRCLGLDSFWILGKLLDRQVKKTWGSSANNLRKTPDARFNDVPFSCIKHITSRCWCVHDGRWRCEMTILVDA
eukprot:1360484-Amorphochlora_amoeboformis.AAC.1